MKKLFIDTNIFLSFYHLSEDDLNEIRKLLLLSEGKELQIITTAQVISEFKRNRDKKVAESIGLLKKVNPKINYTVICRNYDIFIEMREVQKKFEELHSKLISKIIEDYDQKKLSADELIDEIFEKSEIIEVTDLIVEKAKRRCDLGNPPGKPGSLGDAINWECVMSLNQIFEDLYFVTRDKDFSSRVDSLKFNDFLLDEWESEQASNMHYYPSLSRFFNAHYPHIKLDQYKEATFYIQMLENSRSFSETHECIANLNQINDFAPPQVERLIEIAKQNLRVLWIIEDADVRAFYLEIYYKYQDEISASARKSAEEIFNIVPF